MVLCCILQMIWAPTTYGVCSMLLVVWLVVVVV